VYKIQLSGGKTFSVNGERSIIEEAKEQNILLPHSCLTGRCSTCKAKVIEGKTDLIGEEQGLDADEKDTGYILACIRKPLSDLNIDIEDLSDLPQLPESKTIPVKIDQINYASPTVIELVLRYPPHLKFNFIPGQYVNLIKGVVKRSYSIAKASNGKLSFYIKNYEGGAFSSYLFSAAKINDLLRLHGPFGTFILRDEQVDTIVFLATGTGIAPFISMMDNKEQLLSKLGLKQLYIFHGVQTKEEILHQFEVDSESISFTQCLSQDSMDGAEEGYVQDILLKKNINLKNTAVYACGSEAMISDSRDKLINAGLNPKRFYADAFVISS
jgi:CDP-4-dehydro-6-deoxyglucose reductase